MKTMSKIIVSLMDFVNGKRLCIVRFYKTRVISIGLSQGGKDILTNYDHGILKVRDMTKKCLITIKFFYNKRIKYYSYFMLRLCYNLSYFIKIY